MSKEAALALATGQTPPTPLSPEAPAHLDAESTGTETQKEEAPKVPDSDRFAALAKKETDFVKKQQLLKAEREAFHKEREATLAIQEKVKLFEDTRKSNPIEALKLIGFSETEIFNFLASQEKRDLTPEEKAAEVASKIVDEKFKTREDQEAKKLAEQELAQDEKLIGSFKKEMDHIMTTDPEKFEYCAYHGQAAIDLAYQTVLKIVEDSKGEDVPTAFEAMEMIEELYEEEDRNMSNLKKRQPKADDPLRAEVSPKTEAPERTRTLDTAGKDAPRPAVQRSRTLSNSATATVAGSLNRIETASQKRERLMEVLRTGNAALLKR